MRWRPEVRRNATLSPFLTQMDWAGLEFRVHRIGEVDHLVGGQAVEQLIIGLDKGGLLGLIGLSGRLFGRLYSKPRRCIT